ncbi:MAG TPA: hypothetical protein VMV29_18870 [Ktedonobacterales bacterium]|nr:hypothetical protein [Ktedonobacterales bacterium]
MQYGEIISRSLAIAWRHKYLWLLALVAGESAVGFSISTNTNMSPTNGARPTTAVSIRDWTTVTAWIGAHVALLAVMALVFLAVIVALFLVSVVANGAVVRASYEFDAERPFSLGQAWNAGLASFWSVLKVKLIAALVTIMIVSVIGALAGSAAYLVISGATLGGVTLAILGGLFTLAALPFSIVFGVVVLFAVRGVTLDGLSVSAALGHGFHLLQRRLGRTSLLWIIIAALSVVGGLIVGGATLLVGLVFAGIVATVYLAGGIAAAVVVGGLLAIVWLGMTLIASGAVMAFTSTYWTLGYTRLDREPQPMMQRQPPVAA